MLLVLFAIIEVSVFFVASLALPGVIARLGIGRVGAANLLAAGTISLYLVIAHREGAWHKIKHTSADLLYDSFYAGALGGSVVANLTPRLRIRTTRARMTDRHDRIPMRRANPRCRLAW